MRARISGFVLGALVVMAGVFTVQLVVIREVAPDLSYRFSTYVFPDDTFPPGYFEQGRLVNRCLFPVGVTTTFYDAQYHPVTRAEKPGRYGAVVRIRLNGGVVQYRYITLYRTPAEVFWWDDPWTVSGQLPVAAAIDPAVLRNQQREIGSAIKHGFAGDGTSDLAILLAGLSETSPSDPPAVDRTSADARDQAWWYGLRQRLGLISQYPYLVELPQDYASQGSAAFPLILFLHGNDMKGSDLNMLRESGLTDVFKARHLPAIVVAPQCPTTDDWNIHVLSQLIDELCAKYRIDRNRIYLAGFSAGGDTVWNLALEYPDRFAALVTVAGESDPNDAARIKDVPVWAFEGKDDEVVPPQDVIDMVDAIRAAGGHPHLTLYPGVGHGSAKNAFATDALYTWLMAQKRGQPEVITAGVPGS